MAITICINATVYILFYPTNLQTKLKNNNIQFTRLSALNKKSIITPGKLERENIYNFQAKKNVLDIFCYLYG